MLLLASMSFAFTLGRRPAPEPAPPPTPAPSSAPVPVWQGAAGSLYSPTQASLITGMSGSSRQVGDLITVVVEENAQSQVDATTTTSAQADTDFELRSAFGLESQILQANESLGGKISLGMGRATSHNGTGLVSRSNAIAVTLTCTITGILPNGNVLVRGNKKLTVNGEDQYLTLIGQVQPRDITSDNTVSSTRIADLQFESTGDGVVGDKQKVGWAQRIVDTIAP